MLQSTEGSTEAAARLLDASGAASPSSAAPPSAAPANIGSPNLAAEEPQPASRTTSGKLGTSGNTATTPRALKSALRSLKRRRNRRTYSAGAARSGRRQSWGEEQGSALELSVRRESSVSSIGSEASEGQRGVNWASPKSINVLVPITPPSHPQRKGQYGSLIGRRARAQDDEAGDPSGCTDLPVERDPELEPTLGALWYGDSTVLRDVRPGTPLDRAGGSELIGRRVIRVNGCRVDSAEEVTAAAAGRDCVAFRFRPMTTRLAFKTGADIDFLWEGFWRRGAVRAVSVKDMSYLIGVDDGTGGFRDFMVTFDAAQVALRAVRPAGAQSANRRYPKDQRKGKKAGGREEGRDG
eukprot:Hpha_TRINITY_DN31165_c0_g1::TRINITY_DN31165_c0_g1_i1::g.33094::m.33094